jgi:hypothetical protein
MLMPEGYQTSIGTRCWTSAAAPCWAARALQECEKLLDREPRLSKKGAKSPLRQLSMIGDYEATMRWITMAEHDVTATLPVALVPQALKGTDCLTC